MARLFVTDINLNKNELQNARIQGLSSAPSAAVTGQIYYDTSNNTMYYYNGLASPNGPWMPMSGSTEVIQDVIAESVVGGTGLTATYVDSTGITTLDLDNTTVSAGDYGSQTKIPTFTVDAQGRLTAAGEVDVATELTILDDAETPIGINLLTDDLSIKGGEGIDVVASGTTVTISAEDATHTNKGVANFPDTDFEITAGSVTINAERIQDIVSSQIVAGEGIDLTYDDNAGTLTVDAEIATTTNRGVASFNTNDFTVTSGAVEIKNVNLGTQTTGDYVANIQGTTNEITVSPTSGEGTSVTIGLPDDVTISNNLNVGGDLNVAGVINTVNSTQVNISDNKINLNSDMPEENAPSLDAGIVVHRGLEADAELLWSETADRWQTGLVGGSYHDIARKYVDTIGDGTALTYAVTHNLGTREVTVQVYDAATYDTVETDVLRNSTSQVTIGFTAAPASGAYKVVIVG
jgi:hypothetical protein